VKKVTWWELFARREYLVS